MEKFDIIIIGAGPAGMTSALNCLRAGKTVLILESENFGGQIAFSPRVENFPTYPKISGAELMDKLYEQIVEWGARVELECATNVEKTQDCFIVTTDYSQYECYSVILATGVKPRHIGVEREEELIGKGVSYCATCDGNFYKGTDTAVVGGNAHAVSEALYLADLCETVYMLVPADSLTLSGSMKEKLDGKVNVKIIYNAKVIEIYGENKVEGLKYTVNGTELDLHCAGIFVSVGSSPATDFIHIDGLTLDKGFIVVDETCQSSVPGLFAAGDVTNGKLKQIVTACADGAKAGTYACAYAATRN